MMHDTDYMQRCLDLARQGEFTARPNPLVGAVVVAAAGQSFEGYHGCYGEAHAEVNALVHAGSESHGATLYVSLEPCCFRGKTGACTEKVIEAGIRRVVYGMPDPNPKVAGQGIKRLQEAGIEVEGPVLEDEARALNPGFIKRMGQKLPYARLKQAMSLDGRTAMESGESQWITGEEARADVQRWRARSDAIVTGIGTVLDDRPSLNVRLEIDKLRQPLRVITDSQLQTPPDVPALTLPGRVIIATALTEDVLAQHKVRYEGLDVTLLSLPDSEGKVDLRALMHYLAREEECGDVLLECGPTLAGAMLQAGLVDELLTYVAPTLMGNNARPLMQLPGIERMGQRLPLQLLDVVLLGKDCRMRSLVLAEP